MVSKINLEIPVYTVEAALLAEAYGADRLELCADVCEGGTTPSAGLLALLKEKVSIPIFVMIRPRGGDFCYTADELHVMKKDIQVMGQVGADGFVFGVLDRQGRVNGPACRELLGEAGSKPCTFHRAVDVTISLEEALEDIIDSGFKRVLSSGGKDSVGEGMDALLSMLEVARDRIIVMPGGGMKVNHLASLAASGYLREIHSSCKAYRDSESVYRGAEAQLSADMVNFWKVLTLDPKRVRDYKEAIGLL